MIFLLIVMPVISLAALAIRRQETRRRVAHAARAANTAAAVLWLFVIVSIAGGIDVRFYQVYCMPAAVISTLCAAVCAAAEARSTARLRCEDSGEPFVQKRLRAALITLAVFAAVTALELSVLHGIADAAYAARQRPEDAGLYGVLAAAVAALSHVIAARVIFALTPGAGKPRVKDANFKEARS